MTTNVRRTPRSGSRACTVSVPGLLTREIAPFYRAAVQSRTGPGEPARFGFLVYGNPVILDTAVRIGVGLRCHGRRRQHHPDRWVLRQRSDVLGRPRRSRATTTSGAGAARKPRLKRQNLECLVIPSGEVHPPPFLSLPTSCDGPLRSSVTGDTWAQDLQRQVAHLPEQRNRSRNDGVVVLAPRRLQPFAVRPADQGHARQAAASAGRAG